MGKLNNDTLVVMAFFTESCDSCVSMRKLLYRFADDYPDVPIFETTNEDIMDRKGIYAVPTVVVSNDDVSYRIEGECSYEEFLEIFKLFE